MPPKSPQGICIGKSSEVPINGHTVSLKLAFSPYFDYHYVEKIKGSDYFVAFGGLCYWFVKIICKIVEILLKRCFFMTKILDSRKASDKIRNKLLQCGGTAVYTTLRGKQHIFEICNHNQSFRSTTGLGNKIYDFTVFDCVVELLLESPEYRAVKGGGRDEKDKLGYGNAGYDTVVGAIGKNYEGKKQGESVNAPASAICAIMEWAGLVEVQYKYVKLSALYKEQLMRCSDGN